MIDSMMHKKYFSQIGQKCNFGENFDLKRIDSVNMNKSPKRIRPHYLRFTSSIRQPLSFDDIQRNRLIQTS